MEQMRNGIQIVGVVVVIGILNIHCILLRFHEQERNAINKANNIRTATIVFTMNLQFFDGQEVVPTLISWILKINDLSFLFLGLPIRFFTVTGMPSRIRAYFSSLICISEAVEK